MNAVRQLPLLLIVLLGFAMAPAAFAQDRGGDDGERRDRGREWRERWENASEQEREEMREEMRKRMEERRAEYEKQQAEQMRESLGMSAEEFEVISPLIANVRSAMRERDMAMRGGGGRGPGDRGGRGGFGGEQSDDAKAASEAMAELRQAIEDKSSGDIKNALIKLREARAALDKKVTDAREELRGVCTAQWEAQFVLMGVLD